MVTNYLRQWQFPDLPPESSDDAATIVIDDVILVGLERKPVSLICELTSLTCIPTMIMYRYWIESFGFVIKHLRWVPYNLTATQKDSASHYRNTTFDWVPFHQTSNMIAHYHP
jgi:hypothetical protein